MVTLRRDNRADPLPEKVNPQITPEMIEAGAREVYSLIGTDEAWRVADEVAVAVFLAMDALRGKARHLSPVRNREARPSKRATT